MACQKRFSLLLLIVPIFLLAQKPSKPTSSEIFHQIQKLNFIGSVLYIGAHPDDENTRLISYLANDIKAQTTYLSITRGDGGQNLIGSELGELLGVIRTEELLGARKTDGGNQRFTRANDFGFSKNPDETFRIWDKQQVLADVVWAIRSLKPDIIINRFDHRTAGTTHGQHTASAILSYEAYDLARNASQFPEQLKYVDVWTPKRLFFNTSFFFYGSQEAFDKADKSNLSMMETGSFYPNLGLSNGEIAALSRSNHKSQGFGSTGSRGSETEYLEYLKGSVLKKKSDIFEGVTTSWLRFSNGLAIRDIMDQVVAQYDFKNPSASIPKLLEAQTLINKIDDDYWRKIKLNQINEIIAACAGLFVEAVSSTDVTTPGQEIKLKLELINRSIFPITLTGYKVSTSQSSEMPNLQLNDNVSNRLETAAKIPSDANYNSPYWLNEKGSVGMYRVDNQELIGLPETPSGITVDFSFSLNNKATIFLRREVVFKSNDPIKGETYQPLYLLPHVTVQIPDKVLVFKDNAAKKVTVRVNAIKPGISGDLHLELPQGWNSEPKNTTVTFSDGETEKIIAFSVTPPETDSEGVMTPKFSYQQKIYDSEKIEISYDHIPKQIVLLPAESKLVKSNIKIEGKKIAYIQGAGDDVPSGLTQIGYEVTELKQSDITAERLKAFDAVVTGIRVYNVLDDFEPQQKILLQYVADGGTLLVQYNTDSRLKTADFSPYPIKLSRNRVTEEDAEVRLLNPNHEVLNFPNKINNLDFSGWVQERGLYFPSEWGSEFTPIFGMNDFKEPESQGSLLVSKYGKGYYIYTGLSFFRQIPAGVPGAYKLFANLISIGKNGK